MNTTTVELIFFVGCAALVLAFLARRWRRRGMNFTDGFAIFMRSRAATFILIVLVSNTALAQLFFNSGGIILPSVDIRHGYLIASAVLTSTALSLFELLLVHTLSEMTGSGINYKPWEWRKRILSLCFISLYNVYSLALLNFALWPVNGVTQQINGLPAPWAIGWADWLHASTFSGVLLLCGLVGEAKRSYEEHSTVFKDDMLVKLIDDAKIELKSGKPGRAMTALTALSPDTHRAFYGNYYSIMSGDIHIDDVLAHHGTTGIIRPINAAPVASVEESDDDDVPAFVAASMMTATAMPMPVMSGKPDPLLALAETPLEDVTGTYTPGDPRLASYPLPPGVTLMTEGSMTHIADVLGIKQHDLKLAWENTQRFTHHSPRENQRNIQVWQVVALLVMGCIPSQI